MGVQIYLLDRRTATIRIEDLVFEIGTIRRFWKVTEMDEVRNAEIVKAASLIKDGYAPVAVMISDVYDLQLADSSKRLQAHLVLGWDADRTSVTDWHWDYLPELGYAVREVGSSEYVLYELQGDALHMMSRVTATKKGILDDAYSLVRRGQPVIAECLSVVPFISTSSEARCILSNGQEATILTTIDPGILPPAAWYVGKRPKDVSHYPSPQLHEAPASIV